MDSHQRSIQRSNKEARLDICVYIYNFYSDRRAKNYNFIIIVIIIVMTVIKISLIK